MFLNERAKQEIKERGLKQRFLAKRIGITEARFSDLVNGQLPARPEEVLAIAGLFGLDSDEVLADGSYTAVTN